MSAPELRVDLDDFAANLAVVRARVAPARAHARRQGRRLRPRDRADRPPCRRRRACAGSARSTCATALRDARSRPAPGRASSRGSPSAPTRSPPALAADIDLGVGDAGFLEDVAAVAARAARPARVHLKIDTGLHRNGIRPEEWPAVRRPRARARSRPALVARRGRVEPHRRGERRRGRRRARRVRRRGGRRRGGGLRARGAPPRRQRGVLRAARSSATTSSASGRSATASGPAGGPGEADLGIRPIASLDGAGDATSASDARHARRSASLHGLPSTLARRAALVVDGRADRSVQRRRRRSSAVVEAWPDAAAGDEVIVFGAGRVHRRRISPRRSERSARRSSCGSRRSFRGATAAC